VKREYEKKVQVAENAKENKWRENDRQKMERKTER
jgi:hypothetical protein